MTAAALVVLKRASLPGEPTPEFTGVHWHNIIVAFDRCNKNVWCRAFSPGPSLGSQSFCRLRPTLPTRSPCRAHRTPGSGAAVQGREHGYLAGAVALAAARSRGLARHACTRRNLKAII